MGNKQMDRLEAESSRYESRIVGGWYCAWVLLLVVSEQATLKLRNEADSYHSCLSDESTSITWGEVWGVKEYVKARFKITIDNAIAVRETCFWLSDAGESPRSSSR